MESLRFHDGNITNFIDSRSLDVRHVRHQCFLLFFDDFFLNFILCFFNFGGGNVT